MVSCRYLHGASRHRPVSKTRSAPGDTFQASRQVKREMIPHAGVLRPEGRATLKHGRRTTAAAARGPRPAPGPLLHGGRRAPPLWPGRRGAADRPAVAEPPGPPPGTAARRPPVRPHPAGHHAHRRRRGVPAEGQGPAEVRRPGRRGHEGRRQAQPDHGRLHPGDCSSPRRSASCAASTRTRTYRPCTWSGTSPGRPCSTTGWTSW